MGLGPPSEDDANVELPAILLHTLHPFRNIVCKCFVLSNHFIRTISELVVSYEGKRIEALQVQYSAHAASFALIPNGIRAYTVAGPRRHLQWDGT